MKSLDKKSTDEKICDSYLADAPQYVRKYTGFIYTDYNFLLLVDCESKNEF